MASENRREMNRSIVWGQKRLSCTDYVVVAILFYIVRAYLVAVYCLVIILFFVLFFALFQYYITVQFVCVVFVVGHRWIQLKTTRESGYVYECVCVCSVQY